MEKKRELSRTKVMRSILFTIAVFTAIFTSCKSKTNERLTSNIDSINSVPVESEIPLNLKQWDVDSVFEQWNRSTMSFLESPIKSDDPKKTELHEFSKSALSRIMSNKKLSSESRRKTFLIALKRDSILLPEEYFLIETFYEGETSTEITFLAMVHGNTLDILKYIFQEVEDGVSWVSDSTTRLENRILQPLSTYELPAKDGVNEDLVIITHFSDGKADETFFFQRQSLSTNIGLSGIFD